MSEKGLFLISKTAEPLDVFPKRNLNFPGAEPAGIDYAIPMLR
jgi:hypothetical protein